MKSHNKGVEFIREKGADWLIVMSACLRFGEAGGMDFIKVLQDNPDELVIHGAGLWKDENPIALGFHLTAFNKRVFDKIGGWDENFTPYSLDDIDIMLRLNKGFGDELQVKVFPCDFRHESTSHSIGLAKVKASYNPRNSYFKRKWGRDGGDWQNDGYPTPFNLNQPLSYWPEPDNPLSIWQNEYKQGYKFDE
jgi:hypothetical protein